MCSGHRIPGLVEVFFPLSPFIPTFLEDHPPSPVGVLVSSPNSKYSGGFTKKKTQEKT